MVKAMTSMMCNRGQSAVEIEAKGASLAEAPRRDFYTGVQQLLHPLPLLGGLI
jgi:hypothetical protein